MLRIRSAGPRSLLVFLLTAAAAAPPALAQAAANEAEAPAASAPGEIFFDALSVEVVNVDVYVTDKKGEPVTGLTKDDFELYEDGRRVEISNFYAVAETAPQQRRVAALPVEGAPALEELPEEEAVPAEQKLHLVVYIDNLFITPFNRNTVIREVDRFLTLHMRPGDEAMLVTFDRSLNIRQPFTSDPRLVSRALEEQLVQRAFGEQARTERMDLIKRIDQAQNQQAALSDADFYAKSIHHDVTVSLNALSELVGSLGGLPGRKAMLLVSEGMPMTAGEDIFSLVDLRFGRVASARLQANRYRVRRDFRQIVARANSNRVTFYTLDASGGYTNTGISAEYGGSSNSYNEIDFVYDSSRQEPLELLAEGTGGRAAIATANFAAALEDVAQDLTTYYSLGYSPSHAEDGRYHDIEVRVKKPGLEVRHRRGYRSQSIETRLADGTTAALLYGASTNPLDVELDFGRPEADGQGNYLVPVALKIPISSMALLPQGEEHQGRMRVALSVQDSDGDTSPPAQEPFVVSIPSAEMEQASGAYYTYTATLLMRRGVHLVAAGVSDEIGGTTSFLRLPVRVGS
jgi:VWFA-related protein